MASSNEVIGRNNKAEFLLEIFSEEIPARMQAKAANDLKSIFTNALTKGGVKFKEADCYVTARRLVLHIQGLDSKTPDIKKERRGPRADAPEKAIEGFLRGAGVTRDQVEIREEKKGAFLHVVIEQEGISTKKALEDIFKSNLGIFPWPKSMRWGDNSIRWVRPLHSVLAIFDGQKLNLSFLGTEDNLVIPDGNQTRGHRFLAPEAFEVSSFADYKAKLAAAFVILDPAERKDLIHRSAKKLAQEAGLNLLEDEGLLDEVVGLAEYPVVLMGEFDAAFLDVPQEALTSAMKKHQKYFSLVDGQGKLANKFIFVSNMKTNDQGAKIIDGNERVLRARLADTKFFWDQDLKVTLEGRLPALDDIVFHAKLGTVGERVKRLVELSGYIAEQIGADVEQAKRAALLCKADLVSGMVGEFADLQGLMGKYYAEKQGEPAAVANGIAEHYSPKGPSDICPSDPVSVAVALAEKLDSLVGFFGLDEKPTGSKDPFALRRAALGVVRLIIENKLRFRLREALENTFWILAYGYTLAAAEKYEDEHPDTSPRRTIRALREKAIDRIADFPKIQMIQLFVTLSDFFDDRFRIHMKGQGVRHDLITATSGLKWNYDVPDDQEAEGEDDLVRLLARVDALQNFLSTDEGGNLLAGYKRAANILKKETEISGEPTAGTLAEEKNLFERLSKVSAAADKAIADEKFEEAMVHLATLRPAIDAFFDKVTVNSDDKAERLNRLRLLARIRDTMNRVADFSKIEG
ncbi:MAG: glycine--tRNA ligase subunit beta [Alphaproteobacteria bacterium]|nr:MAG: glycine--tRNA ligase subunit beta [Alphaproteobacteria bacterium]